MDKLKILSDLYESFKNCQQCKLHTARKNIVFGTGNFNADILVIGKAPNEADDEHGYPFIDENGRILDYILAKESGQQDLISLASSFKIRSDKFYWDDHYRAKEILCKNIFYTNTVLCIPPNKRDPEKEELKACKNRLYETIYTIDPKIIISIGKVATSLLMNKVINILKIRGQIKDITIPGKSVNITYPVVPILSSHYLTKNRDLQKTEGPWKQTMRDIKMVYTLINYYKGVQ